MRFILLVFFIYISLIFRCNAQNPAMLFEEGKKTYYEQDYGKAISIFEDILEQHERIPVVYLYLANSYKQNLQYTDAIHTYTKVIEMAPHKYPECYLYLGELYEITGDVSNAKLYYSKFSIKSNQNKKDIEFAKKNVSLITNKYSIPLIDSIQLTQDISNPFFQNFGIQKINNSYVYNGLQAINDSISDATFYSNDTTIQKTFCAIFDTTKGSFTDVCPTQKADYYWVIHRNSSNFYDTPNLYSILYKKNEIHEIKKINLAHIDNNILIHPQITIFKDSICLFFTSNLPNGYGGMDIWYSHIDSFDNISKPINAGNDVNTEFDEICPFFYTHDSTLFFSSNRPEAIGGFDIFSKSYKYMEEPILQLQQPFNSTFNDLYFRNFDTILYISSNRIPKNMNNTDFFVNSIYYYNVPNPKSQEKSYDTTIIKTNTPITIYFDFDKPQLNETINYSYQYNTYLNNKISYIQSFTDSSLQFISYKAYSKIINDFYTNHIKKGKTDLDSLIPSIIYNSTILDTIYIELQAFTGKGGTTDYNIQLAQRRIDSTIDYIVSECYKQGGGIEKIQFIIQPHLVSLKTKESSKLFDSEDAEQRKVIIKLIKI